MSSASFTSLLTSDLHPTAGAGRTASGIPKFKSLPPPSLPISPPSAASSWFAIPPGISPAELLDSPILLSASNILPSPTTGSFPNPGFSWQNKDHIKIEQNSFTEFSFQTQNPPPSYPLEEQRWGYLESATQQNFTSSEKSNTAASAIKTNDQSSSQSVRENRKSEDGYNWRKYGQKQVKGSENPRSYYKCTYPNCPIKKKVERSLDGHITEIVYKGDHNHAKPPQSARRSSSSSSSAASSAVVNQSHLNEIPEQSYGSKLDSSVTTPDNSSISVGDNDDLEQSSQINEDEHNLKRWKGEAESATGRAVREPRVVVQTTSDIDILDDGFRWRKYGQKVVKGNPNPRSYYKCTTPGCPVRKHVERASHDPRAVITTYEGKHNHDVPAARGSALNRNNPNSSNHIRPVPLPNNSNYTVPMIDEEAPYRLELLQGGFGYSGFGNPISSNMDLSYENSSSFSRAKDEPREDLFLDSLLC